MKEVIEYTEYESKRYRTAEKGFSLRRLYTERYEVVEYWPQFKNFAFPIMYRIIPMDGHQGGGWWRRWLSPKEFEPLWTILFGCAPPAEGEEYDDEEYEDE